MTANSLSALAKSVQSKSLVLAMYLNVPTTQLVKIRIAAEEKSTSDEEQCLEMLTFWKTMRATAKEREKVADLKRALTEAGFQEMAEVVDETHKDHQELTPEMLPAPAEAAPSA